MACPQCLDCTNPCDECQQNVLATPETFTPELPPCTNGCADSLPTDCILTSDLITLCGDDYPIGTPLTEILTDFAAAVDCTNVTCDQVTKVLSYTYTGITKALSYYSTLDPDYFTKSDIITQIGINDNSSVTNDTLSYLKYSSMPLLTQYILTSGTIGSTFNLATNICGDDLVGNTNEIWTEMLTSRNCFETSMCTLDATQVPYSERYSYPYRANPQINEPPITNTPGIDTALDLGTYYFNDVAATTAFASSGGSVRKINLNTGEVTTLAGNIAVGLTPVTYNNVWGDVVEYDYNSGPVLDQNELVNGEPVIYFCTFKGILCRLVRERNDQCDERANWKNYIIAGKEGTTGDLPVNAGDPAETGTDARFNAPYGIKKWHSINGEPSFLLVDDVNFKLRLVYYVDGVDGKNSSENWNVVQLLTLSGTAPNHAVNINVEDSPTIPGEKRIIILEGRQIRFVDYSAALTLGALTTAGNYISHNSCSGGIAPPADGLGSVAKVTSPHWIARIGDPLGAYYYVIGAESAGASFALADLTTTNRTLRKLEEDPTLALGTVDDYTWSTLIPTTGSTTDGHVGSFASDANIRRTQGMFADLQGNYYDIGRGGIRLYDFGANSILSVLSGADSLANTTVTSAQTSTPMDTQYQLTLNC